MPPSKCESLQSRAPLWRLAVSVQHDYCSDGQYSAIHHLHYCNVARSGVLPAARQAASPGQSNANPASPSSFLTSSRTTTKRARRPPLGWRLSCLQAAAALSSLLPRGSHLQHEAVSMAGTTQFLCATVGCCQQARLGSKSGGYSSSSSSTTESRGGGELQTGLGLACALLVGAAASVCRRAWCGREPSCF